MNSTFGQLFAIVLGGLALAAAAEPDSLRLHRFDGGVAGDLRRLEDGGTGIGWVDGGHEDIPTGTPTYCRADAGTLLRLLAQRTCHGNVDCELVRPELAIEGVECCYAVNARVAKSKEMDKVSRDLERQCGTAYLVCMGPCDHAECRAGKCVTAGPDE